MLCQVVYVMSCEVVYVMLCQVVYVMLCEVVYVMSGSVYKIVLTRRPLQVYHVSSLMTS
jgi:hypothetical protein